MSFYDRKFFLNGPVCLFHSEAETKRKWNRNARISINQSQTIEISTLPIQGGDPWIRIVILLWKANLVPVVQTASSSAEVVVITVTS